MDALDLYLIVLAGLTAACCLVAFIIWLAGVIHDAR